MSSVTPECPECGEPVTEAGARCLGCISEATEGYTKRQCFKCGNDFSSYDGVITNTPNYCGVCGPEMAAQDLKDRFGGGKEYRSPFGNIHSFEHGFLSPQDSAAFEKAHTVDVDLAAEGVAISAILTALNTLPEVSLRRVLAAVNSLTALTGVTILSASPYPKSNGQLNLEALANLQGVVRDESEEAP